MYKQLGAIGWEGLIHEYTFLSAAAKILGVKNPTAYKSCQLPSLWHTLSVLSIPVGCLCHTYATHFQCILVSHLSFLNLTLSWACSVMYIVNSAHPAVCPSLSCFWYKQRRHCPGRPLLKKWLVLPSAAFLHVFTSWLYFFQFCTLPESSHQSLPRIFAYPEGLREGNSGDPVLCPFEFFTRGKAAMLILIIITAPAFCMKPGAYSVLHKYL